MKKLIFTILLSAFVLAGTFGQVQKLNINKDFSFMISTWEENGSQNSAYETIVDVSDDLNVDSVTSGSSIKISWQGKSNIDIKEVSCRLVDRSPAANWWLQLSDLKGRTLGPVIAKDIKKGEAFSFEFDMPIVTDAVSQVSLVFNYTLSSGEKEAVISKVRVPKEKKSKTDSAKEENQVAADAVVTSFQNKKYALEFSDEFDGEKDFSKTWSIIDVDNGISTLSDNDSRMKMLGGNSKYKSIEVVPANEKNVFTENGILHIAQTRELTGARIKTTNFIVQSKKKLAKQNTMIEFKYKVPVKGENSVAAVGFDVGVHRYGNAANKNGNEYRFLNPMNLESGKKDSVYFNPGIAIFSNQGNSYNEHTKATSIDDSKWFDEWHLCQIVWNEKNFTIFQDGEKIKSFSFANYGKAEKDYYINLAYNLSSSGDTSKTGNFSADVPVEFMIDYVKVYSEIK